jgi:hypothetical protein
MDNRIVTIAAKAALLNMNILVHNGKESILLSNIEDKNMIVTVFSDNYQISNLIDSSMKKTWVFCFLRIKIHFISDLHVMK